MATKYKLALNTAAHLIPMIDIMPVIYCSFLACMWFKWCQPLYCHGHKKGYRIESHIKVGTEELLFLSSLHIIGSG